MLSTLDQLNQTAEILYEAGKGFKLWLLDGDLGAGKTTLIQQIGIILNLQEPITSPTFSIANEYHDEADNIYSHFDCYRLKDLSELLDLGFEDYIAKSRYCFVEWASRLDFDYFEIPYFAILIEAYADSCREITFQIQT